MYNETVPRECNGMNLRTHLCFVMGVKLKKKKAKLTLKKMEQFVLSQEEKLHAEWEACQNVLNIKEKYMYSKKLTMKGRKLSKAESL